MPLITEFVQLYRRYVTLHTTCRFTDIKLVHGDEVVGYVEECVFTREWLRVRGWSLSHELILESGDLRHSVPRRIQRGDVAIALAAQLLATKNQHGRVGFDLKFPWSRNAVRLIAEDLPGGGLWDLPVPDEETIRSARRRTQVRFLRDILWATPAGLRFLLGGRRRADRDRVRALLGIDKGPVQDLSLNPAFLAPASTPDCGYPTTTIILPVYNAFELLTKALARVDRNTDVPWHLVLVEDSSTDERVRPWLQDWAATRADRVSLLLNEQNLGFVGSVNRGLAFSAQHRGPVVLLNSDALVPKGWASRLLCPILENDRVASVTPMSNDATILTVPWIASRVDLPHGTADQIDLAARRLSPQARAQIPTGVGFCMAMSRAALDAVPTLDPAFGRGYGEEVDWCRKTAKKGMIHLGIGNLFVEHRGGTSFGSVEKTKALENSARIIRARHPEFDDEVRRFISADPLLTARLCLGLVYAAASDSEPLHVYLCHSLGGGAEHWLAARIEERNEAGKPTVTIRVGGPRRFKIGLHAEGTVLTGDTDDIDLVRKLILLIPQRHIVYSCGVGDDRPWELPELLCDLATQEGAGLDILFHDYFPISPSLNLLNADGSYTGVPPTTSEDPAHQILGANHHVSLQSWRERWGAAVRQADQLTVFSQSSAEIVADAWPAARDKIILKPHQMLIDVPRLADNENGDERGAIGVLGAIGAVKGARVVSDLARHLERQPDAPKLVVVGEFDHSFHLPPSVKVTGRYDPKTLPGMLALHDIKVWLMPSIWPETFSFTTHEMLATGRPVMAFDLGAQGEAVRKAKNGHIVSSDPVSIYDCYRRVSGKKLKRNK